MQMNADGSSARISQRLLSRHEHPRVGRKSMHHHSPGSASSARPSSFAVVRGWDKGSWPHSQPEKESALLLSHPRHSTGVGTRRLRTKAQCTTQIDRAPTLMHPIRQGRRVEHCSHILIGPTASHANRTDMASRQIKHATTRALACASSSRCTSTACAAAAAFASPTTGYLECRACVPRVVLRRFRQHGGAREVRQVWGAHGMWGRV